MYFRPGAASARLRCGVLAFVAGLVFSSGAWAFSCTAIPTTLGGSGTPVAAGSGNLSIGNNSTLSTGTTACTTANGTTCTAAAGSDTTLTQGTGVGPPTQTLPAFQPATFPAVGTSDVSKSHNSTLAEGSYKKVSTAGTVTFSGGTYYMDELVADKSGSNQPVLKMAAGDYFINKFSGGNNLTLQVTSGPVRIFIKTSWQVGNDASINVGGTASNFQMFAYNNASLQFGNNENSNTDTDFVGLIYAPGSGTSIQMGNNNVIQGAVLSGGTVSLGNNIGVIFDTATQTAVASINSCSLSGNWTMDELSWSNGATIADSSGNALNGTLTTTSSGSTSKVCNGGVFAGSAYVSVANNPRIQLSGGGTFSFWIKPTTNTSQLIFAKGSEYYAYLNASGKLVVGWGASTTAVTSTSTISAGSWTHVAVRLDDAAGKAYIHLNGSTTADTTTTVAIAISNASNALTIGGASSPTAIVAGLANLTGTMDEFKIFKGLALTGADINDIYTKENASKDFSTGVVRTCPVSGPHHLEISDSSGGSGLTCAATTLTIKACADANSPCTVYTSGVDGTLTATPVSGSPTVIWGGSSANFSIAAGSSTITKTLQVTTASSPVTIGTTSLAPSASSTTTCSFQSPSNNCQYTASATGFLVSASPRYACAAQTVTLQAVQSSTTTTACVGNSTFNGTNRTITLYARDTNTSNTTGTISLRYPSGASGGTTNTVSSLSSNSASPTTLTGLYWDGTASAVLSNFTYADAGQLQLFPSYTGSVATGDSGLTLSGVGGATVVVAPKSFEFTGMPTEPLVAGTTYTAPKLVARHDVDTASDIVACRTTGTTVNFNKELTPQSPTLTGTRLEPTGATAQDGTISVSVGSFTSGEGDLSLMWTEIGKLTLTGSVSNYLSSGLSVTSGANNVRFAPSYFDVTLVPLTGCTGFVYSGQPFGVTIKAYSAPWGTPSASSITKNYDGALTSTPAHAITLSETTGAAGTLANTSVASSAFTQGQTTVAASTTSPKWTFTAAAPTASAQLPTSITLRATDAVDTGITSSGHETAASATVRRGRLRVANAFGSEKLALSVPLSMEYWTGSYWAASTGDSCTQLFTTASGASSAASYTPGATSTATQACFGVCTSASVANTAGSPFDYAGTALVGTLTGTLTSTASTPSFAAVASGDSTTFNAGRLSLVMGAPLTKTGSLIMTLVVPDWLQIGGVNPTANVGFGVYNPLGNSSRIIYRREVR
jgi:MSHA biogenesis protein MshQ